MTCGGIAGRKSRADRYRFFGLLAPAYGGTVVSNRVWFAEGSNSRVVQFSQGFHCFILCSNLLTTLIRPYLPRTLKLRRLFCSRSWASYLCWRTYSHQWQFLL